MASCALAPIIAAPSSTNAKTKYFIAFPLYRCGRGDDCACKLANRGYFECDAAESSQRQGVGAVRTPSVKIAGNPAASIGDGFRYAQPILHAAESGPAAQVGNPIALLDPS